MKILVLVPGLYGELTTYSYAVSQMILTHILILCVIQKMHMRPQNASAFYKQIGNTV